MQPQVNMSDQTLLVSVEDLICMAMGPPDGNTIDFKMVQMVLHILARQMRLLEQKVVLEVGPLPDPVWRRKGDTTSESTSSSAKGKGGRKARDKSHIAGIREEGEDDDGGDKHVGKRSKSGGRGSREDEGGRDDGGRGGRGGEGGREEGKRSKSMDRGRDDERGGRDAEKGGKGGKDAEKGRTGSKEEAKGGKGGKDVDKGGKDEKGGKADKDVEKGAKGGKGEAKGGKGDKEAEKGGKGGKDEARAAKGDKDVEKGGKGGKDEAKVGKGDKDVEKGGKGGKDQTKAGKGDKDVEKGGKGSKDDSQSSKSDKDVAKGGKGGKDVEKGGKGGKDSEKRDKEKTGKEGKEAKLGTEEGKTDKDSKKDKEKGGIGIKEVTGKGKEKLLVVEKGPTTRAPERGRRSIEVVTRSQFALLQAAVEELQRKSLPPPPPAMPGNEKLRSDLAAGSATLTDAMQAMQVAARVQAAEQAIGRLGGLLTTLAGAGALPGARDDDDDDDDDEEEITPRGRPSTTSRKSVVIQSSKGDAANRRQSVATTASQASAGTQASVAGLTRGGGLSRPSATSGLARPSVAAVSAGRPSITSRASVGQPLVTQGEMNNAITDLRQDIMKSVQAMVSRAQGAADAAASVAKAVGEKLELATRLSSRITSLHALVNDYAEQLAGFDAGLTTQMLSFQEQMTVMRKDLQSGLAQLENANNNAETAAVMELTERYELLAADLDHTLLAHQALTTFQQQLTLDFKTLYSCVEMLREQKADRDEVLDGLRDKADNDRLAGLLREEEFKEERDKLEMRLDLCHEKFRKQDNMWVTALKDLTHVVQTKAELMDLLKTREETTEQLQEIQDMIKKLALVLGEPKAAMLTRRLARDAVCGACLVPALMEPEDAARGAPPPLPAALPARGAPVGAEQPCAPEWHPPQPPDLRTHKCHRWVGGSHTLLAVGNRVTPVPPEPPLPTTRKYTGVGFDGRLYMMEAELEPCIECNPLPEEGGAAGDARPLGVIYHGVDVVGLEQPCDCNSDAQEKEKEKETDVKEEEKGDGEQQRPLTTAISFVKSFGK